MVAVKRGAQGCCQHGTEEGVGGGGMAHTWKTMKHSLTRLQETSTMHREGVGVWLQGRWRGADGVRRAQQDGEATANATGSRGDGLLEAFWDTWCLGPAQ